MILRGAQKNNHDQDKTVTLGTDPMNYTHKNKQVTWLMAALFLFYCVSSNYCDLKFNKKDI